ncbi:hypothetical protein KI387_011991, partial [Taxus chinensis]
EAIYQHHFERLQQYYRLLVGEDLSRLNVKDLDQLEQQLQTSLHRIRNRKEQILMNEIEERLRKERSLEEENMHLRKTISVKEQSNNHGSCVDNNINYGKEEEKGNCDGGAAINSALKLQL